MHTGSTPTELAAELQDQLRTRALGRTVVVRDRLGSTQDLAREMAEGGAPHGSLAWALEQTAGRGRLARSWLSAPGAGLWFSLVLRPQIEPQEVAVLGLVAGVGVVRALDLHVRAGLKWPNDVQVDGRKVAGLLAEAATSEGALRHVILGVGLNVVPPPGGFPPDLADRAAALFDRPGAAPSATELLAQLLAGVEQALEDHQAGGSAWLRTAWMERSETIGQEVRVELAGSIIEGMAIDLTGSGELVVRDSAGRDHEVIAGEVQRLRPRG